MRLFFPLPHRERIKVRVISFHSSPATLKGSHYVSLSLYGRGKSFMLIVGLLTSNLPLLVRTPTKSNVVRGFRLAWASMSYGSVNRKRVALRFPLPSWERVMLPSKLHRPVILRESPPKAERPKNLAFFELSDSSSLGLRMTSNR